MSWADILKRHLAAAVEDNSDVPQVEVNNIVANVAGSIRRATRPMTQHEVDELVAEPTGTDGRNQ